MMKLAVLALTALTVVSAAADVDDRPIIGILTLPNYNKDFSGRSYFPASYVKWLESGGARVVPIKYTDSLDDIKALTKQLNGALFTGGGATFMENGELTTFGAAGYAVLETIVEMNENGAHVPLWATCLGFQLLNVLSAGPDNSVLYTGLDSENLAIPLTPTDDFKTSRMFGAAGPAIQSILVNQNSTMNNHQSGILPSAYQTNQKLADRFNVLSTNVDRKGKEFISSVEGKTLPLYATQWHPEKVQFEWRPDEVIPHSADAVTANSFFARWVGQEARRNNNSFTSVPDLIYNYQAVYTAPKIASFEQCYFFE